MMPRTALRNARMARGFTLKDVEKLTQGDIKAVTLGTWERGTRMLSVEQLCKLWTLYELSIIEIGVILGDFYDESPF